MLISVVFYLWIDLHCEEEPEAGMRLHRVKLLLQLHQPTWSQVDILQHHPPGKQEIRLTDESEGREERIKIQRETSPARFDSSVDVSVSFIESFS